MNEKYQSDFIENRKKMINEMADADKEQLIKDFEMPSIDEIMKLVNSMDGVSEEHREKLRDHFLKRAGVQNPFSGDILEQNPTIPPPTPFEVISLIVYLIMLITFISVCGKTCLFQK